MALQRGLWHLAAPDRCALPRCGGHAGGGGLPRLIANENPYGPSPAARAAALQAVQEGWKYVIREVSALKRQLAEREPG